MMYCFYFLFIMPLEQLTGRYRNRLLHLSFKIVKRRFFLPRNGMRQYRLLCRVWSPGMWLYQWGRETRLFLCLQRVLQRRLIALCKSMKELFFASLFLLLCHSWRDIKIRFEWLEWLIKGFFKKTKNFFQGEPSFLDGIEQLVSKHLSQLCG